MQIIKDQRLCEDSWQYVADDAMALPEGKVCVPLSRWLNADAELLHHEGHLGVRINPADTIDGLAGKLDRIGLVELDFPKFADGRLFSFAWLLRSRYGFQGEIRAVGHYLPDQAFYLSRVGVNAFKPEKPEQLALILSHFQDFTAQYQDSVN